MSLLKPVKVNWGPSLLALALAMHTAAFWIPCHLWWLLIPTHVIIAWAYATQYLSFWSGFCWWSVTNFLSLIGFHYALAWKLLNVPLYNKAAIACMLVFFYGITGATWFWLAQQLALLLRKGSHLFQIALWTVATVLWIIFSLRCFPIAECKHMHVNSPYVCIVRTIFKRPANAPTLAREIVESCRSARTSQKQSIFLFPESAARLPFLADPIVPLILAEELGPEAQVIIGGFHVEDKKIYNSVFWLGEGRLKGFYDKKSAFMWNERLPDWVSYGWIRRLVSPKEIFLAKGSDERPVWDIPRLGKVTPFICSELYFAYIPQIPKNTMVLAMCNNDWAPEYVQELLKLNATFKAYCWRRKILYISNR